MRLLPRDVDVGQWRALMLVSFKTLQRQQSHLSMGKRSHLSGIWVGLLFYGVMGIVFAGATFSATNAGAAAFILASFISVFISTLVLLEFGSAIVSPDDVAVLAVRPVSSRTYFAARLSTVIAFVLLYGCALGCPSVVSFASRFGILVGLAWLVAVLAGSLAAGLLMVLVYTTALRHVPAARVRSVMGYVQMGLSFVIYGGYGLLADKFAILMSTPELPAYAPFLPPGWFASIVALAAGQWTTAHWVGLGMSVLLLALLFRAMAGRIALTYAESAAAAATETGASTRPAKVSRPGLIRFLRRHEDRAVALLLLRQFRYDVKFKMSVLTIIPLTILYLYQGIRQRGSLVDPFVSASGFGPSVLLYVAVILFPVILKNEIVRSDMYQASWVFYASPVRKGELILSVRRVITALFVLPYLALLSLIFLYFFRHPGHVLLHMLVLYLASDLFLQALFLMTPQLPFSSPRMVGERVTALSLAMITGPLFFLAIMSLFTFFLYASLWRYAAGVVVLVALSLLLRSLLNRRAMRAGEKLEYGW